MDELEQQLKRALARKEPSAGFADRVIERGARVRPVRAMPSPRPRIGTPWWLATAATVVMMVGSGVAYRRHQGEVAKEQVMTAMRLTAVKLHHIQTQVREVRQ